MKLMKFRIKKNKNEKNMQHSQSIVSIEKNLDSILSQKMDLILKIQKKEKDLKSRSFITKKHSPYNRYDNYYNNSARKKQEIINKRITLSQLLMKNDFKKEENNLIDKDYKKINNIKMNGINDNIINDIINSKNKNNKNNSMNNISISTINSMNNKNNYNDKNTNLERDFVRKNDKKENTIFFKRRRNRKKSIETLRIKIQNNNHFNLYVSKADKIIIKRKIGKRYTLLKQIMNYLESNNITLYELIRNNPFQSKPYELSKSYEFLEAVKFRNYDYVLDALHFSRNYLFSFDYFGQTGYHWAAKLGDLKMLKLLMEYGLHHNQKDFKGRTPLYLAAFNNHKEICNYLLINNGNIFLRDKNGLGPADVAPNKELKFFLFDYMAQPFSNPTYKAKIQSILKERELKIKIKKEEKEKIKKQMEEQNRQDNDDENDNEEQ